MGRKYFKSGWLARAKARISSFVSKHKTETAIGTLALGTIAAVGGYYGMKKYKPRRRRGGW